MLDDVANDALDALSSCQCCLLGGQQRSLKTPYVHQRKAEIYSDMLRECFDIRLNLGSAKSGICLVCVGRLREACSFKQQVQRSQLELRRRLTRALGILDEEPAAAVKQETSDDAITSVNLPDEEAPVEVPDADSDVLICEEPDVKLETEGDGARDSLALEEPAAVVKWEMDIEEDVVNDNMSGLQASDKDPTVKSEQSDDDSSSEEDYVWPSWSVSMCARAREQLAMTCSVRLERLQYEEAPHTCQICHITFDHESSLATHLKNTHGEGDNHIHKGDNDNPHNMNDNDNVCDIFKKQLMLGDSDRHITHAKHKRFNCEICNKSFSCNSHMKRHVLIHTGEKPFKCAICNKRFNQKSTLTNHTRIHTGQAPFKCAICNKRFNQKGTLTKHTRIHTGQEPFKCEICNKRFIHKSALNGHYSMHAGEKPYSCRICNKQFIVRSYLLKHIRLHAGEKPYSCVICNMRFARREYLEIHFKIHTRKPFKCPICNKRFSHKNGLKYHVMLHTGQKPFNCNICNKKFALKKYLTAHIGRHLFNTAVNDTRPAAIAFVAHD